MSEKAPLRVAIIGTAKRSNYLYGPIIKALPGEIELVAVWGRSKDSTQSLSDSLGVSGYTDIEVLMRETAPDIGIVSVSYSANGEVGLMAVEAGLHVLLETPIAHKLSEADAIIAAAQERGLKIEIAEQFHRRPLEQIKLKLLETGLFGRVHTSFNDFAGHGYHGVSVLRSYLGYDCQPIQVSGAVRDYELTAHWSRLADTHGPRTETQEHGRIEFEAGQIGIFHWTNVGYDSALRWWRSSRFLAEKGMGITIGVGLDIEERLSLLSPGGEAPRFITLERRWERVDGGALTAMVAHTGDPDIPFVRWENPFRPAVQGHGVQWHDDEIGVAGCLLSLVNAVRNEVEPTYGPLQGRLDQELIMAIRMSSMNGGQPVKLPIDPNLQEL
ncbi:Gfo/Idh/MocA family protein [Chloroflexota bacterium]